MARHAVIFGGTSGIGRATAADLLDRGFRVTICGSRPSTQTEVAETPPSKMLATWQVDLRDAASLAEFADTIGTIDALIISIGRRSAGKPFLDASFSDLVEQIDLRITAGLRALHVLAPNLAADASVTFVSGVAARRALPNAAALSIVNAALEAAVMALAVEMAPIRVNCVAPGRLDTGFWDGLPDAGRDAMRADAAARLPVGRIGQAEDAAGAIAYLIGAGFVTGTVLDCDGGMKL